MGKRADRKAFKKNGVDAAMSVADAEPSGGGGGDGWSYGDQISAMAEDGKDGADVSAAAKKKPSSGGALTAGGVRMRCASSVPRMVILDATDSTVEQEALGDSAEVRRARARVVVDVS